MVNVRVLVGMTFGAFIGAAGALFLGEYEFDESLPIAAGPLLGLIMAEVVVSVGRHRSRTMAVMVAVGAGVSVVLAGHIDANGVGPVKIGAYGAAAGGAVLAFVRTMPWRASQNSALELPPEPEPPGTPHPGVGAEQGPVTEPATAADPPRPDSSPRPAPPAAPRPRDRGQPLSPVIRRPRPTPPSER